MGKDHPWLGPAEPAQTRGLRGAVQHCQTWQTYITAIRQVRADGVTVINPQTGCPRKNPALSAAETAGAQLLASCREFGLTPSSEQRLAAAPAEDDGDPFAG
jgi:P27 family predicted phage terminase small subunit